MKGLRYLLPFVIAVFCFLLFVLFGKTYKPEAVVVKTYDRVNNRLKERKTKIFDYQRTAEFLQAYGASYCYGKWINPVNYMGIRLIVSAVFFYVGIQFHWAAALVLMILGYKIPRILIWYSNRKDNEKMLSQIMTVYKALESLTHSGVYITNALKECYKRLPDGRLRDAFEEMASELFVKKSLEEAVEHLNSKFKNEFIDTLCIIIRQAKETGKSIDLLGDIKEQIADMNGVLLQKKKNALDRRGTFLIMIVLGAGVIFLVYALLTNLFDVSKMIV